MKKLEKEKEFEVKTILDKVQLLLAEFADVTPSNQIAYNLRKIYNIV